MLKNDFVKVILLEKSEKVNKVKILVNLEDFCPISRNRNQKTYYDGGEIGVQKLLGTKCSF